MAIQYHNVTDARRDAEGKFSDAQVKLAKPVVDAFVWRLLEIIQKDLGRLSRRNDREIVKIDNEMAELSFDGENHEMCSVCEHGAEHHDGADACRFEDCTCRCLEYADAEASA